MNASPRNNKILAGSGAHFPPEFDAAFVAKRHPLLACLGPAALRRHHERIGRSRGDQASAPATRTAFVDLFDGIRPILEIGPFDRPMVRGDGVAYFDVLDQDELAAKARRIGRTGVVPPIDFVSPNGDLSIVTGQFAAVCSSHCIEHQTDTVRHLKHVGRILRPGGHYFLIVPDKRFCFDHFIPESTVAEMIEAHEQRHSVHTLSNVIRHRALATHNDVKRHWRGDHLSPGYRDNMARRIRAARQQFADAKGAYIDVHAWRFTPAGFAETLGQLHKVGLTRLKPIRVYETPRPRVEFTAILEKAVR